MLMRRGCSCRGGHNRSSLPQLAPGDGLLGLRSHSFLQHSRERTVEGWEWLEGTRPVQRLQVRVLWLHGWDSYPGFAVSCETGASYFNSTSPFLHLQMIVAPQRDCCKSYGYWSIWLVSEQSAVIISGIWHSWWTSGYHQPGGCSWPKSVTKEQTPVSPETHWVRKNEDNWRGGIRRWGSLEAESCVKYLGMIRRLHLYWSNWGLWEAQLMHPGSWQAFFSLHHGEWLSLHQLTEWGWGKSLCAWSGPVSWGDCWALGWAWESGKEVKPFSALWSKSITKKAHISGGNQVTWKLTNFWLLASCPFFPLQQLRDLSQGFTLWASWDPGLELEPRGGGSWEPQGP